MKTRLIATFLGSVALAGSAAAADDNPGKGTVLELYARTTDFYTELTAPPQPGQRAIYGRDLYALGGTPQAPEPTGDVLGRQTLICTLVTSTEANCHGTWFVDGLGLITGAAYLDFAAPPMPGAPGASLTGGSGVFAGAAGVINNRPVQGTPDQVWTIDISGISDH